MSKSRLPPRLQDGCRSTVLDRIFGEDFFALIERLGGSVFGFRAAVHHLVQRGLKNMFGVHLGGGWVRDIINATIGGVIILVILSLIRR